MSHDCFTDRMPWLRRTDLRKILLELRHRSAVSELRRSALARLSFLLLLWQGQPHMPRPRRCLSGLRGSSPAWHLPGSLLQSSSWWLASHPAYRLPPAMATASASQNGGPAPDISNMTPRERFNRLYNRVMQAAQSGDEATVSRFTPMALAAYAQLDTIDSDARYHAALLKVHTGNVAESRALADTILAAIRDISSDTSSGEQSPVFRRMRRSSAGPTADF